MANEKEAPERLDLTQFSADGAKSEDMGMLSLRYVDGTPALVLSDGMLVPSEITVVDSSGSPVAMYSAGPPSTERRGRNMQGINKYGVWYVD
ncbi:hypothetical protein [Streptomyces hydrogenans]|uniref:hypothetical protein n=1 Tax=Streptomyces hydrogenans TaxID=1873719 RepID=UPI0035D919C6